MLQKPTAADLDLRLISTAADYRQDIAGGNSSRPAVSKPLRPALPAICNSSLWYRAECDVSRRRDRVEMTVVRAGMLIPAARVSVANTTFSHNSIGDNHLVIRVITVVSSDHDIESKDTNLITSTAIAITIAVMFKIAMTISIRTTYWKRAWAVFCSP